MSGTLEAENQKHPQQILEELDKLLETNPLLPSYSDGMNDPDYTIQHEHMRQLCSKSRERNISYVVEQASAMIDENKKTTFRICSIGCGDGYFDKEVLTQLLRKYPHLDIQYLGLDVNKFSCQRAQELLGSLEGVQIKILAKDIQHASPADFEPCDLVIAVHVLYYVESLKDAISCALKVVKPNGCLIMINGHRYPLSEVYHRFWLHEHKRRLWYTQDIEKVLTEMGIAYCIQRSGGSLDVPNFEKGFQSPPGVYVLDFLAHTKLSRYPPAVAQICIEYFSSIAEGKPDRFILTQEADILYVESMGSAEANQ